MAADIGDGGIYGPALMEEALQAGVRRLPDAPQITGPAIRHTDVGGIKRLINRFGHQLPSLETQRTILSPAPAHFDLQLILQRKLEQLQIGNRRRQIVQ